MIEKIDREIKFGQWAWTSKIKIAANAAAILAAKLS